MRLMITVGRPNQENWHGPHETQNWKPIRHKYGHQPARNTNKRTLSVWRKNEMEIKTSLPSYIFFRIFEMKTSATQLHNYTMCWYWWWWWWWKVRRLEGETDVRFKGRCRFTCFQTLLEKVFLPSWAQREVWEVYHPDDPPWPCRQKAGQVLVMMMMMLMMLMMMMMMIFRFLAWVRVPFDRPGMSSSPPFPNNRYLHHLHHHHHHHHHNWHHHHFHHHHHHHHLHHHHWHHHSWYLLTLSTLDFGR